MIFFFFISRNFQKLFEFRVERRSKKSHSWGGGWVHTHDIFILRHTN